MSKAFPSSSFFLGKHAMRSANDYLQRMNQHKENAENAIQARTIHTDHETRTVWESPQALSECAHESDLEEYYFERFLSCTLQGNRALWSDYRHACFCGVRKSETRTTSSAHALSWWEIATAHACRKRKAHAPPGLVHAPNVLATCHAPNAPGLSRIANDIGRSSPPSS